MGALLATVMTLSALVAASLVQPAGEPGAIEAEAATQALERISPAQLAAMVEAPMKRVESGDVEGGERAFEALLASQAASHGPDSVVVADHLMGFGLGMFQQSGRARTRSLVYLWRAFETYRRVFGPRHGEAVLALNTYVDGEILVEADDPPNGVVEALEERYRAGVEAQGAGATEPAVTLMRLAEIRGMPSRTRGDPERIAAAAQLFRDAIRTLATDREEPDRDGSIAGYFRLASMYLRNRRPGEAVAAAIEADADYRRRFAGDDEMCSAVGADSERLYRTLREAGHLSEANRIKQVFSRPGSCFGIEISMPPIEFGGPAPPPRP